MISMKYKEYILCQLFFNLLDFEIKGTEEIYIFTKWEPLRCQEYFIKIPTHYTKSEVKFVAVGGNVNFLLVLNFVVKNLHTCSVCFGIYYVTLSKNMLYYEDSLCWLK